MRRKLQLEKSPITLRRVDGKVYAEDELLRLRFEAEQADGSGEEAP